MGGVRWHVVRKALMRCRSVRLLVRDAGRAKGKRVATFHGVFPAAFSDAGLAPLQ